MDNYRYVVSAEFEGTVMQVGDYESLVSAIKYGDNIGTMFSEGHPPKEVIIRIEGQYGHLLVEQHFYNGYITVVIDNLEVTA